MEIIRIISLLILGMIDMLFMFCYLLAIYDDDKNGANIMLIMLTMFVIPTIYIGLN